MKIGYVRVSTAEQNTARQEIIMEALEANSVYIDRVSGKDTRRPELQKMLSYLRPGDTVVVESISRFARNTKDLLELMETLEAKGAAFISQKEAIDTTTPSGKFMLTVFGAMAELERDYIRLRQKEGIAIAKANGVYHGRPVRKIAEWEQVTTLEQSGEITAREAARRLGISTSTYYRRLKGGRQ
ncbi:MAG: recombinase family protein [Firmicutes bacterium]|nr:recombinase family protein [Bacillota bacterium]